MKSPCVKTCQIDETSGLCLGCLRSLEEIAGWSGYSDALRAQIMAQLAERKSQLPRPLSQEAS